MRIQGFPEAQIQAILDKIDADTRDITDTGQAGRVKKGKELGRFILTEEELARIRGEGSN